MWIPAFFLGARPRRAKSGAQNLFRVRNQHENYPPKSGGEDLFRVRNRHENSPQIRRGKLFDRRRFHL